MDWHIYIYICISTLLKVGWFSSSCFKKPRNVHWQWLSRCNIHEIMRPSRRHCAATGFWMCSVEDGERKPRCLNGRIPQKKYYMKWLLEEYSLINKQWFINPGLTLVKDIAMQHALKPPPPGSLGHLPPFQFMVRVMLQCPSQLTKISTFTKVGWSAKKKGILAIGILAIGFGDFFAFLWSRSSHVSNFPRKIQPSSKPTSCTKQLGASLRPTYQSMF